MVVVPVPVIVVAVHGRVIAVVVIVLLERAAFPDGPVNHARHVEEPDHAGVPGERIDRAGQRGLQRVADHEDDIGVLQRRGVGGTHGEGMRRGGAADEQVRLADAGHHRAHQRMHRLDRGDDAHAVVSGDGAGGRAAEERRSGKREQGTPWCQRRTSHGLSSPGQTITQAIM